MSTDIVEHWNAKVNRAAAEFEERWTMLALWRADPKLADRLRDQIGMFNHQKAIGSKQGIAVHGAATVRGWVAAIAAMEKIKEPDTAYMIGSCPITGLKIAIGHQKAAVKRLPKDVVWISPDEVATLMATAEAFTRVAALKRAFPGAEVVRHPTNGEKA